MITIEVKTRENDINFIENIKSNQHEILLKCDQKMQTWHNCSPGKSVSVQGCLDWVGLKACLWGGGHGLSLLLPWCGKTQLKGTWYHMLGLGPELCRREETKLSTKHVCSYSLCSRAQMWCGWLPQGPATVTSLKCWAIYNLDVQAKLNPFSIGALVTARCFSITAIETGGHTSWSGLYMEGGDGCTTMHLLPPTPHWKIAKRGHLMNLLSQVRLLLIEGQI